MKTRRVLAFFLLVGASVASWALLCWIGLAPGGDGVVARLTLKDGTEFKVIQRFTFDPYTIDFYFRKPGSPWGWCYIDHEDLRWRSGRLEYSPVKHSVQVFHGSELRAEYFVDRNTFALYAEYQRELPAPQEVRDPPM